MAERAIYWISASTIETQERQVQAYRTREYGMLLARVPYLPAHKPDDLANPHDMFAVKAKRYLSTGE